MKPYETLLNPYSNPYKSPKNLLGSQLFAGRHDFSGPNHSKFISLGTSFRDIRSAGIVMIPSGKHTKNYGKIHHSEWVHEL